MPILIECPTCGKQLRVQDALIGKKVKCPNCTTTFPAAAVGGGPAPSAAPAASTPPSVPARPAPPPPPDEVEYQGEAEYGNDDDDERRIKKKKKHRRAAERVKLPAIFLIILGSLGALGALVGIAIRVFALSIPYVAVQPQAGGPEQNLPPEFNRPPFNRPGMNPPQQQQQREDFMKAMQTGQAIGSVLATVGAVFGLITSGLMIFGAIQMMRLKTYGLALTSAIMALLSGLTMCLSCGCVGLCIIPFDIGVGIWALVVVLNGEVKAAFG